MDLNSAGGGIGKYPEKSVDDTTEEEFDVDAIMKDPTYEESNESFDQHIVSSQNLPKQIAFSQKRFLNCYLKKKLVKNSIYFS